MAGVSADDYLDMADRVRAIIEDLPRSSMAASAAKHSLEDAARIFDQRAAELLLRRERMTRPAP